MHVSDLDHAEAFVTMDGSTIRELVGAVSLPARQQSLAEATVPVGGATAEHCDVRAGECVVIAPGQVHTLVNTGGEPLRLLCCCALPYSDEDTVLTGG